MLRSWRAGISATAMKAAPSIGEVQWMTAGSGVIHNEDMNAKGRVRLLQLWLTLPKNERWTAPAFQAIHSDSIPVRYVPGAEVEPTLRRASVLVTEWSQLLATLTNCSATR